MYKYHNVLPQVQIVINASERKTLKVIQLSNVAVRSAYIMQITYAQSLRRGTRLNMIMYDMIRCIRP